jgi:hypothetical protein
MAGMTTFNFLLAACRITAGPGRLSSNKQTEDKDVKRAVLYHLFYLENTFKDSFVFEMLK